MAAHDVDAIALAAFSLVGSLIDELERSDPGARRRIVQNAISGQQAGANDPRVLELLGFLAP